MCSHAYILYDIINKQISILLFIFYEEYPTKKKNNNNTEKNLFTPFVYTQV